MAWRDDAEPTVGLTLGIPGGLVVGSFVWRLVDNLGVTTTAAIPTPAILLTIPTALALVTLIAFFPARTAAHTRPGITLRSE